MVSIIIIIRAVIIRETVVLASTVIDAFGCPLAVNCSLHSNFRRFKNFFTWGPRLLVLCSIEIRRNDKLSADHGCSAMRYCAALRIQ